MSAAGIENISHIVRRAAQSRANHLKVGRPMIDSKGFKEANIAHDISWSFRLSNYLAFPEFPFKGGSIDAVFIRQNHLVVCEYKKLHSRSISAISRQTIRMKRFKAEQVLARHEFEPLEQPWKVSYLWVCDSWEEEPVRWWLRRKSRFLTAFPLAGWKRGKHEFHPLGKHPNDYYPYWWVWAIK